MAETIKDGNQEIEQPYSRRKLFKWLGLVGTGASLATLGLSNPLRALAAPDPTCNPATCDSCYVTECDVHNTCPSQPAILVHYTVTTCTSGGCLPVNHTACLSSCSCP